jgi:biotin synthase
VTPEQAQALKDAGVTRYNHNLEASENFFPEIVTTHSWRDRVATIKNLKAAGIQACTGGILGWGKAGKIESICTGAAGTGSGISATKPAQSSTRNIPLGERPKLDAYEALKAIAIFRLILPEQILRYAGGREAVMGELQALGLKSGINAMLIGHYLTTMGQPPEQDHAMLESLD